MTQAQFAQWLGVSIKQVKYLEHQRRNPSGPTRRLLGILALQLSFEGAAPVQILGAGPSRPKSPTHPSEPKNPPAKKNGGDENAVELTAAATAEAIVPDSNVPALATDDEAFVWL